MSSKVTATGMSMCTESIRAATIADGTTEIQRYIVAREMGFFR